MSCEFLPVHRLLEDSADSCAQSVAVVHGEKSFTYHDVEEQANGIANLLRARGIVRGDRVALLADNGFEYVTGFFGILKAGAGCVALSGANKVPTHRKLLADSGARALITRAIQVRTDLPDLVRDLPDLELVVLDRANPKWDLPPNLQLALADDVAQSLTTRPNLETKNEDLCAILYTSGSTGMPRGVTLTHGNLAANTRQILAYLNLQSDDSILAVLPFHYSFGNSLLLTHFAVGGRVVVDNRFAYPSAVVDTLAEQAVTGFSGVPSTYAILAAQTNFLTRPLPALRYLTQAGGGMTPTLTRRVYEAFEGRARLFVMYGQTEASARLSYVPPEKLMEKLGSIGIGIPDVDLAVHRDDGTECDVDEVGQVVARGDNIMTGYWNDPKETQLVLRDRTLYTGDLGRRDRDGFIFLVDRIKNMIKAGANRVSAKEVEDTIAEIDGVVEVSVVGVPDELLGEAIEAHVVVGEGGPDEKAIQGYLRGALALFKIPRVVHFYDALPKHASGKINKSALKTG